MSSFSWDDNLLTGDTEIDTHHKAFFLKARRLAVSCEVGKGEQELVEALAFFVDYAKHHFAAEEKRMAACDYPYARTHAEEHQRFLQLLEELRQRQTTDDGNVVAKATAELVRDWFTRHIKNVDFPLIRYMRDAEA